MDITPDLFSEKVANGRNSLVLRKGHEWTSLKKKGVFMLVKQREIDPSATLIPTKWVYK